MEPSPVTAAPSTPPPVVLELQAAHVVVIELAHGRKVLVVARDGADAQSSDFRRRVEWIRCVERA